MRTYIGVQLLQVSIELLASQLGHMAAIVFTHIREDLNWESASVEQVWVLCPHGAIVAAADRVDGGLGD